MMQDFMDPNSHQSEGPEFEIGWRFSSPLMLSPTNEAFNPFFAMMSGETLILDPGMGSPMQTKQRLTPDELDFTRGQEDFLDLDYFSLDNTTVKHQRSLHPTRLSSASLASTTSSATPSEADSDLIDRVNQDEETSLLHLNMASCSFPATSNVGLGFQVGYVPSTRGNRNDAAIHQQQHQQVTPSHASIALNSFNLSDFISDQEQEHYQQHSYTTEAARPTSFVTPERPLAVHDMRMLALRSASYSPASTNSPQTPDWEGGRFKPSTARSSLKREHDFDGHMNNTDGQLHGQQGHLRPKMLMRAYTDSAEILSCNPSQITPNHAHLMEQVSEDRGGYFYSLRHGQEMEHNIFTGDDYSTSPPSLYSSPTQEYHNLWSSIEGNETKPDAFDGSSSPLFHHRDSRDMSLAHSAPSPQSNEPLETDYFASAGRVGAMRSARLSAMAASRRNSLPYKSPPIDQSRFESPNQVKAVAMPGIITKRSRGRRVPNNPEELSNLGKSGKVYTCKVPGCGKCFKRSEHLKRHVRSIHTNEKPFTCHCGKTFSRHDNLNQHARVHLLDGEDGSASESASVSPSTSPTSLTGSFVGSQRGSFSLASSRLRTIAGEDEEDATEGNMFALDD